MKGLGCTPFEAMFGIKCRNDLEELCLPANVMKSLKNEQDLTSVFHTKGLLAGAYAPNQFDVCEKEFLRITEVKNNSHFFT